jgi:hypothetical protein
MYHVYVFAGQLHQWNWLAFVRGNVPLSAALGSIAPRSWWMPHCTMMDIGLQLTQTFSPSLSTVLEGV